MLFNSAAFIFVFLPATLTIFFIICRFSHSLALFFLTIASLIFFGQTDSRHILILVPSIVINYLIGLKLSDNIRERNRVALIWFGVAINLGCLFVFKYLDLLIYTVDQVTAADIALPKIQLPLGISFFTFTQIAFLVDAYQRKVGEPRFLNYALFVSYFPHLVAGPILHHAEMMPQFSAAATFRPKIENFAIGLSVFFIGLFKKVIVADSLAPHVHRIFDAAGQETSLSALEGWSGALFYALQIYFDFSGYSDMAIGLSLLFGVKLPVNFNSPYKAVNIIEFWRRWHITLSRFLRDYLYIPLGGSRAGEVRRLSNVMIVMLLGGLWHGASWTFVVWGGLHGIYLMANHAWQMVIGAKHPRSRLSVWAGRFVTFLLVTVAWVVFRSPTLGTALVIAKGMFGLSTLVPLNQAGSNLPSSDVAAIAAAALAVAWFMPNTQEIMSLYKPALNGPPQIGAVSSPLLWRPTVTYAIIVGTVAVASLATIIFEKRVGDFIYFQF